MSPPLGVNGLTSDLGLSLGLNVLAEKWGPKQLFLPTRSVPPTLKKSQELKCSVIARTLEGLRS